MKRQEIRVDRLQPNPWNPNMMTIEGYKELIAEVRHLGRIPKPIIVRRNGDGYEIIDGEHNWKAAQKVGLKTVPCEIESDMDDQEAMRQTYKRNRGGTDDPEKLGQLFQAMAKKSGSQRKLAKEIGVAATTIANHIRFAKLCKRYSKEIVEKVPTNLRHLLEKLPVGIGNWWASSGGNYQTLLGPKYRDWRRKWSEEKRLDSRMYLYERVADLTEVVEIPPSNDKQFEEHLSHIHELYKYEAYECGDAASMEEVKEYTRPFFRLIVPGRFSSYEMKWMDMILDVETGDFNITSEQFIDCIVNCEGHSSELPDLIRVAVYEATGELPVESGESNEDKLMRIRFEQHAPEWLKSCPHDEKHRHVLFIEWWGEQEQRREYGEQFEEEAYGDSLFQEVAQDEAFGQLDVEWRRSVRHFLHQRQIDKRRAVEEAETEAARREWLAASTEDSLATEIAERFYDYEQNKEVGKERVDAGRSRMASILCQLTKDELMAMHDYFTEWDVAKARHARYEQLVAMRRVSDEEAIDGWNQMINRQSREIS